MPEAFPSFPLPPTEDPPATGWVARLVPLLATAHAVWSSPHERRHMRAFGFRPAVENGVLKRDWHGVAVRVSPDELRAASPELGELVLRAEERTLWLDGAPFTDRPGASELTDLVLNLIVSYERWLEAREGREARLRRSHALATDRRPMNALAETRRLQRLLHATWGRPPGR